MGARSTAFWGRETVEINTGQIGPPGSKGEQGPKGDPGPNGPNGAVGTKGDQGPKGDAGVSGSQGEMGLGGAAGTAGPAGPVGPQGAAGPAGLQGPSTWEASGNNTFFNAGNVGIGTATPTATLDVAGSINAQATVTADSLRGASLIITGDDSATSPGQLVLRGATNNAERLQIGYNTDRDYASIQAVHENVAFTPLVLQPADGRVGIGTTTPEHPLQVGTNSTNGNGAHVTAGGVWTNSSDRNTKSAFEPIDKQGVLASVVALPITKWQYRGEPGSVRHIGPMAQDFFAAFGLGSSERHIGTVDADGVALVAIQALHQTLQAKNAQIDAQRAKIEDLHARLARLEKAVAKMTE